MVAGGGSNDDGEAGAASTTSPESVTSAPASTTSVPSTSITTTTVAPTSTVPPGPLNVDPPPHPSGDRWNAELVIAAQDAYVTVDLDTGDVGELDWPKEAYVESLSTDAEGRLLAQGAGYEIYDAGEVRSFANGEDGFGYLVDGELVTPRYGFVELDLVEGSTGDVVKSFPSSMYLSHLGHRAIVQHASGWAVLDPSTDWTLNAESPGTVVDANDTHVAWQECPDLACNLYVAPIDDLNASVASPLLRPFGGAILAPGGSNIAVPTSNRLCGELDVYTTDTAELVGTLGCPDNFARLDWSPDGAALFIVESIPSPTHIEVVMLDASTGATTELAIPHAHSTAARPSIDGFVVRPRP